MARLFSCCSSAFFIVFATLFVLGFLVTGVPGMADEPIPPPNDAVCNDELAPDDCADANNYCGNTVECCYCLDENDVPDCMCAKPCFPGQDCPSDG
jgi:hypothetical protein